MVEGYIKYGSRYFDFHILDRARGTILNPNPLDLIERNLVIAAVIETGCSGRFMIRHLLCHFKHAAVAQVFRDTRRAEAMAADLGKYLHPGRAAPDHSVCVRLAHGIVRQLF